MTYAKDFIGAIVFLSFFISINYGYMALDRIQNGYHSEKQAYVGQYFKAKIDFGPGLFCNVSRLQVSEAYSHEQPSWLILNASSRLLHGIPQENEIGSVILFSTGFGNNAEGQEFVCSQLVWKLTVELDPNSLVLALSQYIDNRTNDQREVDSLQMCLSHPSIIIATLNIGINLGSSTRPLSGIFNLLADTLNTSTEVIQVVDGSSSITFHKQLKSLKILRYEAFLKPSSDDNLYHVSWPLGCDQSNFDLFAIHKVHRRSLSSMMALKINSWHLTSGYISEEVLARKRRAVFFGSITALEGTPVETSILPTKIITSAIFTSISSVDETHSFSNTQFVSTSTPNPSSAFTEANASSALSTLPTTKLTSYHVIANMTSSLSRIEPNLTSVHMTSKAISSHTGLFEPHSSQPNARTLMSSPPVVHESTHRDFLSSYPSSILESSFKVTLSSLSYFSPSLSHPPSSIPSSCSSGHCADVSASFGSLGSNSAFTSLPNDSSSIFYSSSIIHLRASTSNSLSGSFFESEIATTRVTSSDNKTSSVEFSSARPSLFTSVILPPSIAPTQYTSTMPLSTTFSSVSIADSSYSTVSLNSLHHTPTSSFSTPYRRTSIEFSSAVPMVSSHVPTAFASSIRGTKNFTSETMTMQLVSILQSTRTIYTGSSSWYLKAVSSSVQYQPKSTRISSSISTALSIGGSFTSSTGAFTAVTSQTTPKLSTTLPFLSTITAESISRYIELSSFSIARQRTSGNNFNRTSMVFGSSPAASTSPIRSVSNFSLQPTTMQLPSSLPPINSIGASDYSEHSFASTVGVILSVSLAKVRSTLTFPLKSITSAYSTALSYSLSEQKDSSRDISSIWRATSSSIPSLLIRNLSSLVPPKSDHLSFGSTSSQFSYILQSAKSIPSNLILSTETAITPRIVKSASDAFSSNKLLLSTNGISSFGGFTSSSTMVLIQSKTITASLYSPIVDFSSKFLLQSSESISTAKSTLLQPATIRVSTKSLRTSAVLLSSSDIKTRQNPSLTSHFTNLSFPSSSMETFSLTSAMVRTQMPNTGPTLVNSLGTVTAYVGRLLTYTVPFDTFYDRESGYTPNLTVTCRYANGQPLEQSFWIVYNNATQTFTGLPFIDEYNKQGSDGARLEVIARDQFGGTARDVFNIYINNIAVDIQFSLSARLSRQFQEFQADSSLKVSLFTRIIRFYNTSAMNSYYASSLTNGSVLLTWSDTTVSGVTCNKSAIAKISDFIRAPSGSVTSEFAQAMLPDFPVLGVTLSYHGVCLIAPTPTTSSVGPAAGGRTGEIFTRFVVPTIAVAVALALVIGAFIFLSKRRRSKPSFLEKRIFSQGRPVLLPEEYELDGIKSPVVSLPEDYVFSNAEDRHSNYSHRLSENGDEEDRVYMDNPLYGMSEFKKPPPAYSKESDIDEFESDYESPYSRPPPSYQLPPFYKDQDFMTSEV